MEGRWVWGRKEGCCSACHKCDRDVWIELWFWGQICGQRPDLQADRSPGHPGCVKHGRPWVLLGPPHPADFLTAVCLFFFDESLLIPALCFSCPLLARIRVYIFFFPPHSAKNEP